MAIEQKSSESSKMPGHKTFSFFTNTSHQQTAKHNRAGRASP